MICAHGECAAPPEEPEDVSTDTTTDEDVSSGPELKPDGEISVDTADDIGNPEGQSGEPSGDLESTQDDVSGLPTTQTAGTSNVGREGCATAVTPLSLWPFLVLLMGLRRRRA